jgi:hypothetical protein
VLYDEQIGRAHGEQDDRVPVDPVAQATPSRPRQVLIHGQRVDVTDPTAVKIARCRVMRRVGASPKVVWRERQHPDDAPDPVVGVTTMEERTMTAIMLDHEKPHEKARCRHREQQG